MIQTDIPDPLLQHPEYASSVLKMSHDWFAHSAVLNGATKVVDALGEFQEKFIKRIPWTGGDTCAHAAVRQNNIDMLKVLLKHNPTLLNKRNYFGKTPFGIAKRGTEVFDYLEAIKLRDRLIKKIEKKSRYMPDADASAAEKQAVFTAFKEADQKNNWREFSEQYPQFKKQIKGQQFHQVHPVRRKIGALFRLFKDKVTPKRYQSPTDESKMRIKKKI
jgi:hypothetical protein